MHHISRFFTIFICIYFHFSYQQLYTCNSAAAAHVVAQQIKQLQKSMQHNDIIQRIRSLEETIQHKSHTQVYKNHPEEFQEDLEKLVVNIKKLISLDVQELQGIQASLPLITLLLCYTATVCGTLYVACKYSDTHNEEALFTFLKNAGIASGVSILFSIWLAYKNCTSIKELHDIVHDDTTWKNITDYNQPTSKIIETIFQQIVAVLSNNATEIFAQELIEYTHAELRNVK